MIEASKTYLGSKDLFGSNTQEAEEAIVRVLKTFIYFKSTFEFIVRRNKRLLGMSNSDMSPEDFFGPVSAFISRCQDLHQICITNQQFLGYICFP